MKKIALSLIAIAALSTSALARTDIDPRDRDGATWAPAAAMSYATEAAAMKVKTIRYSGEVMPDRDPKTLTAFERLQLQSMENENSGN